MPVPGAGTLAAAEPERRGDPDRGRGVERPRDQGPRAEERMVDRLNEMDRRIDRLAEEIAAMRRSMRAEQPGAGPPFGRPPFADRVGPLPQGPRPPRPFWGPPGPPPGPFAQNRFAPPGPPRGEQRPPRWDGPWGERDRARKPRKVLADGHAAVMALSPSVGRTGMNRVPNEGRSPSKCAMAKIVAVKASAVFRTARPADPKVERGVPRVVLLSARLMTVKVTAAPKEDATMHRLAKGIGAAK